MSNSNPTMSVTLWLNCTCQLSYDQKYQDPHPEAGSEYDCLNHGATTIRKWSRVSR